MNKRQKITSMERGNVKITCYRDRELNEYQVRVYVNGVYQGDEKTYYTDDMEDAIITMEYMLCHWQKNKTAAETPAPIDMDAVNKAFTRIRQALADVDSAINSLKEV